MTPVTIVCGPPGAGKSTYVAQHKGSGDLVLDVDLLFRALTLGDGREKPDGILPFVLAARDAVIKLLKAGLMGPSRAWIIMGGENNAPRLELSQSLNANVVIIPTPTGECVARMKKQGRPDWHIQEVEPVCLKWHRVFEIMPGENAQVSEGYGRAFGADGYPE